MTRSTSIFDIHIIADHVAQYLSTQDRASCSLVSKTFHTQFQPHLWREISVRPLKTCRASRQPSSEALLANKELIRKLRVFDLPVAGASQSTGSTYEPHEGFARHVTPHIPPPPMIKSGTLGMKQDDDSVRSLLTLAEQSTKLQSWFIDLFGMLDTTSYWMRFFKVLAHHPSLTSLHIHGQEFHHGVYRALFQSLPTTLETLEIRSIIYNIVTPIHFPVPPSRGPYRRLRFVHLRMCMKGREDMILFPFLRLCPNLEELTVPLMDSSAMGRMISVLGDATMFPVLRGLYMACQFMFHDMDLSRLVQAMKGRIREYGMDGRCGQAVTRVFCPTLATHWAATLESLVFGVDTIVSSHEIQAIATSCSRLKRLSIASRGCEYERDRMVVPEDNISGWKAIFTDDKNEKTVDWVCLDLEELQLTILDDRWTTDEDDDDDNDINIVNHHGQVSESSSAAAAAAAAAASSHTTITKTTTSPQSRSRDGILRAYQQLGRLTKLKTLTLSWYSSRREQSPVTSTTTTSSPLASSSPPSAAAVVAAAAAAAANAGAASNSGAGSSSVWYRFDMSLESGLQHMDQLKELRELNVGGISCLKIGQKEVEWMAQNWPKLRRCAGLVHDKSVALENAVNRVHHQHSMNEGCSRSNSHIKY
ncbi:hypothetical protein BGX31_007401 [Mortierella sp. GBA43]|nr:hypothetical protein BGX31_007401 [Mortierella sp. GBA43]